MVTREWIVKFVEIYDSGLGPLEFKKQLGLTSDEVNFYALFINQFKNILNGTQKLEVPSAPKIISKQDGGIITDGLGINKEAPDEDDIPQESNYLNKDVTFARQFIEFVSTGASLKSFKTIGIHTPESLKDHMSRMDSYRKLVSSSNIVNSIETKPNKVFKKPPRPLSNENLKILVIMPCYNAGGLVEEAVSSIMNNKYTNFTLVCCNDASKDDTHKILLNLQNKYEFVLMNNANNLGTGRTINRIAAWMTGEGIKDNPNKSNFGAITWVSADNIYYDSFLHEHAECLKSGNAISFSSYDVIGEFSCTNIVKPIYNLKKQLYDSCYIGPSFMYRKKLWDLAGPYHEYPGEDWVFFAKCAALDARFGAIEKTLMAYRKHGNSVTGALKRGEIKNICSDDAKSIALNFAPERNGKNSFE